MPPSTDRTGEFRRALAAMGPYLLSHHREGDRHRCHRFRVGDRQVALCARCVGVYPGIAVGLCVFLLGIGTRLWPPIVVFGPLPALLDWAVTTFTDRRGDNAVRTATGLALGAAYGLAVPWFLTTATTWLVGVALWYGAAAAVGLRLSR